MAILESYRQSLLEAASLLFLVGVLIGFLETANFIFASQILFYLLTPTYPSSSYLVAAIITILWNVSVSIAAAILSWDCYTNLKKGKLKVASLRGIVSGALLIITGMWLPGFLVIIAGLTSRIYAK